MVVLEIQEELEIPVDQEIVDNLEEFHSKPILYLVSKFY